MSEFWPEPSWCSFCHPDGDEQHNKECCCGIKLRKQAQAQREAA